MSLIFLPILLFLGAVAAILVILARRVPDMKRVLREGAGKKEDKIEIKVTDADGEFSLAPKAAVLAQPIEPVAKKRFFRFFSFAGKFLLNLLKAAGRGIVAAGKFLVRFFHRVPTAVKIPKFNAKFKKKEVLPAVENLEKEEVPPITTADIKPMEKHPLRLPEPLPKKSSKRIPPLKRTRTRLKKTVEEAAPKEETGMEMNYENPEKIVSDSIEMEMTEVEVNDSKTRFVGSIKPKKPVVEETYNEREALTYAPLSSNPIESVIQNSLAEDNYQVISNMIAAGNYVQSESKLIDILSKNPRDTEAYRLLGIIYLKKGEISQAKEVFEEAIRRNPDHPGLHGPLGFCLVSVGQYGKALQMYQRAHDMDEDNIEYLEQLLAISSRMDRRPLVKVAAQKILAINPSHAEAKRVLDRMKVR